MSNVEDLAAHIRYLREVASWSTNSFQYWYGFFYTFNIMAYYQQWIILKNLCTITKMLNTFLNAGSLDICIVFLTSIIHCQFYIFLNFRNMRTDRKRQIMKKLVTCTSLYSSMCMQSDNKKKSKCNFELTCQIFKIYK